MLMHNEPLPAGARDKPDVGSWDWINDAIYEGESSELTGELVDILGSNTRVRAAILSCIAA